LLLQHELWVPIELIPPTICSRRRDAGKLARPERIGGEEHGFLSRGFDNTAIIGAYGRKIFSAMRENFTTHSPTAGALFPPAGLLVQPNRYGAIGSELPELER
jgi:hypothetical protein